MNMRKKVTLGLDFGRDLSVCVYVGAVNAVELSGLHGDFS